MRYRRLGKTGLDVSVVGFGASPLGDEFGILDQAEGERAVHSAVDCGINFFDVAPYYGRTLAESRLGAAIQGRRHRVVVATKCGRYDTASFDFSADRVKTSVEESLSRLRTDYIDLLTAHDIEFGNREQIVHETIPAMRELRRAGKVRHIGISGLQLKLLADVAVRGEVDYVLSYCRYNLLARDLDELLAPVLAPRGIGLINASPLHMRLLTEAGPPAWHPAQEAVKVAGTEVVRLCIAHGVDPAVLAVAFCLNHAYAASTLVGISNTKELDQNLQALDFTPKPELLSEIERIVEPVKNMNWTSGWTENHDFKN